MVPQADDGRNKAGDGRQMGLCLTPLIHKDGNKKGRHGKIDSRHVEGQNLPQSGSCHGTCYPVHLIKQGDQKHRFFLIHPRRRL